MTDIQFSVQEFSMNLAKQFASLYVIDKAGINNMINSNSNTIARNTLRGTTWYFSNQAIEQLSTGDSNLKQMQVKKLVDDIFFNSLASFAIETTGVHSMLNNVVDATINQSSNIDDVLTTALIVEFVNLAGKRLESTLIKNLSDKLGLKSGGRYF